jgi:hypothetical protein
MGDPPALGQTAKGVASLRATRYTGPVLCHTAPCLYRLQASRYRDNVYQKARTASVEPATL